VAFHRAALAAILKDARVVKAFEKGKDKRDDIERELRRYKRYILIGGRRREGESVKLRYAALALGAAILAHGAAPLYVENFVPGYNANNWASTGTPNVTTSGLTSTTNGSLIYRPAIPVEYEVRTTYRLTQSGGKYVTYLRAGVNANLWALGNSGPFYAVELSDPVLSGGTWSATLTLWQYANGALTSLAATGIWCQDNLVLRVVIRNGWIFVFRDEYGIIFSGVGVHIPSGNPGVGVAATPAGNGISRVEIYPVDAVAPAQPQMRQSTLFQTMSRCSGRGRGRCQWIGSVYLRCVSAPEHERSVDPRDQLAQFELCGSCAAGAEHPVLLPDPCL
jgi:hypothetical protein